MNTEIENMQVNADDVENLRKELAANQAREAQLRGALRELVELMEDTRRGDYNPDSFTCQPAFEALALPQDTTALSDMIAKAGEVMREAVIEQCVAMGAMSRDGAFIEEIRALPGVTLEDLL